MKYLLTLLTVLGGCFAVASAQGNFDVVKAVADPDTRKFDDGTTTVESYVNARLSSATSCCGQDKIYLQLKLNPDGSANAVRVLSGNDTCLKKSVEDIVQYIRWKPHERPIFFYVVVNIECNASKTKAYAKVPAPDGWTGGAVASGEQPKAPEKLTELEIRNKAEVPPQPKPEPKAGTGEPEASAEPGEPAAPKPEAPKPQPKPQPKAPAAAPSGNWLANSPIDTAAAAKKMIGKALPMPVYKGGVDYKPDESHVGTILNEQGPRNDTPEFVDGESGLGVFIKSTYRRFGVCGLAHALVEMQIMPDGTVGEYRIFDVNNEQVQKVTPYVIGSLKFRPIRYKQFYILEFKTDVDCPGRGKVNLEQVGYYFNAPEKGARPRAPESDVEMPKDN